MYYITKAGVKFLNEVKSSVEHEAAIRAKKTKKTKAFQDRLGARGIPTRRSQFPDAIADKAKYPEDYPPHTTDPDSPEQSGQRAGIVAGDLRHQRLKKIASETLLNKVGRKAGKAFRKAEIAIRIPHKGLTNEDTTETKGARLQRIAREHLKLLVQGKKDSEEAKALRAKYRQHENRVGDFFRRLSRNIRQKPGKWTNARRERASDRAVRQAHKKADQNKATETDVSEGIRDWFRRKKKPSQPITLPKKSSAADRGQGKKTGEGEASLGDQATEISNTRANQKAIDDIGK